MAIEGLCVLNKLTSMQDKENNNWIILDQLGNIYKIYANMAVATFLLSLNQSWMKQLNYV